MKKTVAILALSLLATMFSAINAVAQTANVKNETHSKAKMMRVDLPSEDTTSLKVVTATAPVNSTPQGFTIPANAEIESCGPDSFWDWRMWIRKIGLTLGKKITFFLKDENDKKTKLLSFTVVEGGLQYNAADRHPSVNVAYDPNFNSGALYLDTVIPFDENGWTKYQLTINLRMGEPEFQGCQQFVMEVTSPEGATGTMKVEFEAFVVTRNGDTDIPTERPCGPKQSCEQVCTTICWAPVEYWISNLPCSSCQIVIYTGKNQWVTYNATTIREWLKQGLSTYASPNQKLRAVFIAAQLSANFADCNELKRAQILASSLLCYDVEPIDGIKTVGQWYDKTAETLSQGAGSDSLKAIYSKLTGGDNAARPGGVCWRIVRR